MLGCFFLLAPFPNQQMVNRWNLTVMWSCIIGSNHNSFQDGIWVAFLRNQGPKNLSNPYVLQLCVYIYICHFYIHAYNCILLYICIYSIYTCIWTIEYRLNNLNPGFIWVATIGNIFSNSKAIGITRKTIHLYRDGKSSLPGDDG